MLDWKYFTLVVTFSIILLIPTIDAEVSSNPNLFVSAENSQFDNYFSGSMVIEVVIRDSNLHDTDQGKGEPDVTINGKSLRMVQTTDGNWYAYFANVDKAKIADSTQSATSGKGLDFGVFCSRDTVSSVFGVSFSETDGIAVPKSTGLTGFTNGVSSLSQCTGSPTGSTNLNNVVRNAKSINTHSNIPTGQIGLDSDAWPLIQLYSFDGVNIQYNPGGPLQQVLLEYDDIQNISLNVDRDLYPKNAEVFLTVNDFQLNQDPTDEDSWTFDIDSNPSSFYQAFDNSGNNDANGSVGLVNLIPTLSNLGFENNGKLTLELGNIMRLKTNSDQPNSSVSDGGANTFSNIVTLVEQGPNSGIFESYDSSDQSVIGILTDAPRGLTGKITYNKESVSVLTGFSTASISSGEPILTIGNGDMLRPGTKYPVILNDPDQNLNTGARDDLDVFRATAIIPTITIGNPITLKNAKNAQFHSSSPPLTAGVAVTSSVPDSNSDRLIIDTVTDGSYEVFSINLGFSASSLSSILLDSSKSNTNGTNWINYDLRSFERDLGVSNFSDTSFSLSFDTLGSSSITIIDAGDISSSQGFIQIDDSDVKAIAANSGNAFLVIDFDSSNNNSGVITISNEINNQPIVFDFFSFGLQNNNSINNSIYRFELKETQDNSSVFDGTFEYAVTNQLNILDPNFIQTIQTIDDKIKIIITNKLIDEEGIAISYSDLDKVGVSTTTSIKSDLATNSGIVSSTSTTFRFGQPVTLVLKDFDLNLKSDTIESYQTINDPNSANVDTVGKDGEILLEIKLKDIRYKRCTINGVDYGGLGATGFTLVETGPSTGIFEGVFKMPSKICNKSGTELISTAGGSLDAKYYDSRDSFGNPNVFSLLRDTSTSFYSLTQLSAYDVIKPDSGKVKEIILTGSIDNHRRGIPLSVVIISPDGKIQNFAATLSSNGIYKSVISINENSLSGIYEIELSYNNSFVKTISFTVSNPAIPGWIKDNARSWSSDTVSDSEFIDGIEYFVEKGLIIIPNESVSQFEQKIPEWIKNTAKWWSNNQITDEDFVKLIQYLVKKGIIRI